jgi:dihydrofolate synthase / folylpolyglutamate synthase
MDSSEYQQTLKYLYDSLPVFQRIGAAAYKNDLSNTLTLCEVLGNPQLKFKSIHVAGTNGKGSSSHMIAGILQSAGYKTGLYTSPHLKSFTERIKINGEEIEQVAVIDFVNRIKPTLENIHPSFFEMTVAMAFDYFADRKVDIAVVEVGLGGRLDSTNVILPEVSLITNISFDHKDLLGDTLQKIAFEKAGIIKKNIPVVISEEQEQVREVFMAKAGERNSELTFASREYSVKKNKSKAGYDIYKDNELVYLELCPQLEGIYQQKNIAGVLAGIDRLREKGFSISEKNVRDGIENVVSLTGLKGRWQKLGEHPLIIADTGHNEGGIRELVKQIKMQQYENLLIVFGVVKDKDISGILKLLPKEAKYYFCTAKIPRAMNAGVLAELAGQYELHGLVEEDVNKAFDLAKKDASPGDFIFIGGSTFVVAEIEGL